jgi:hypothetical protein
MSVSKSINMGFVANFIASFIAPPMVTTGQWVSPRLARAVSASP